MSGASRAEIAWHDRERARLQWVAARQLLEHGRPGFVDVAWQR